MNDSLESVRDAFASWRSSRASSRGRYPRELRARAVGLLDRHSIAEVTEALGISRLRFIEQWRKQVQQHGGAAAGSVASSKSEDFFELAPARVARLVAGEWPLEIELSGPMGRQLRVRGAVDSAAVRMLAELVLQGTPGLEPRQ